MLEINFYENIDDKLLKFAVIIAKINNKWIFCNHKKRNTYEIPGGHRENNEIIMETACRELKEETGALDFNITDICVYFVRVKTLINKNDDEETFGMFFYAEIFYFEEIDSKIEKIMIADELIEDLKALKNLNYLIM